LCQELRLGKYKAKGAVEGKKDKNSKHRAKKQHIIIIGTIHCGNEINPTPKSRFKSKSEIPHCKQARQTIPCPTPLPNTRM